MPTTKNTLALIDKTIEDKQESSFRTHLGASIIGHECSRYLWYTFRWVKDLKHKARLLRLFDRGNLEEVRFEKWFKDAGIKVFTKAENGKQFRVTDHFCHFGGSLDGVGIGIPDLPAQYFVFEFKTHKEQSFKKLLVDKVKKSKWQHYIQTQIYMHKKKLKWALYCAINKNDDSLYLELVRYDKKVAEKYIKRAGQIIFTDEPPIKINPNPRWHTCLMCSYHGICHGFELPAINCRTCAHSTPEHEKISINDEYQGHWSCQLKKKKIHINPKEGCPQHVFNPHMLNGVTFGECNLEENWITLELPNGEAIKHGPQERACMLKLPANSSG